MACFGLGLAAQAARGLRLGVQARLAEPCVIGGHHLHLGASIGVALHPIDPALTLTTAISCADLATSEAKRLGRGRVEGYHDELATRQQRKLALSVALNTAHLDGSLHLLFQPIVAAHSGVPVAYEALLRWHVLDCLTLNGTYSFVNVSKNEGIQVNTTSPHAATASLDYKFTKKNYRLNAVFSASYMGRKKFDVQDRVFVEEDNKSYDAYFRCDLPQYVLCNLSVSQTFYNKVKLTLGVDNIFNYVPKTLGSGITMFNVPATPGTRGWVQLEFMLDDVINSLRKKK